MAFVSAKLLTILVLSVFASFSVSRAGDPDILTDFVAPANGLTNGTFFTFSGFRSVFQSDPPPNFNVTKAGLAEFPALDGQSVSMAILQFPAGGVNPPHTHPRSAELLFVVGGSLQVGFVDTTNKLFTQTLQLGDIFLFPKGLVHFQFNPDPNNRAIAISAFGSANAGTVSVPKTIFSTGIDDTILAKAFKTDAATIEKLKAGLAS